MIGVVLSYIQSTVFKGCILTRVQFGMNGNKTFFGHYLNKIGIKISYKYQQIISVWFKPVAVLVVAFIIQSIFNFKPIIF